MTFNSIRKAITNNDKIIRSNWVRYSFFLNVFVSFSPFIHQDLYVKKIIQPGETTISTNKPQGPPIHRTPVAHEPRHHQLWLDRPARMSSSSLLPTVKQRKIHTWKFGDKHIEMAETGALGVFFEGLLLKSMQKTHELVSAGKICHRSCGCCMAWCWLQFSCFLCLKVPGFLLQLGDERLPPTLFSWKLEENSPLGIGLPL